MLPAGPTHDKQQCDWSDWIRLSKIVEQCLCVAIYPPVGGMSESWLAHEKTAPNMTRP